MKFRNNINYFKKKDVIKSIGIVLLVLGAILLFVNFGYISWILMILFISSGFLMSIIGSIISSNEGDMDEYISRECMGLELDLEEDKDFSKRILKNVAPNITQGYEYSGEGLMFRKDKKGSWRSSKYTKSVIYVLSDALYINSRTISLISDEVENKLFEIAYDTMDSVEIKREENTIVVGKNSFKLNKDRLVIKYREGKTFCAPMNNDIKSEEFVDMLNKLILSAKKQKEE